MIYRIIEKPDLDTLCAQLMDFPDRISDWDFWVPHPPEGIRQWVSIVPLQKDTNDWSKN